MSDIGGNNRQETNRDEGEKISGWDILRIILATILILAVGAIAVASIGLFELMQRGGLPDSEQIEEWAEGELSTLPASVKFLGMVVQASLILPLVLFLRKRKLSLRTHLRLHPVPIRLIGYSVLIGIAIAVLGDEVSRIMDFILPVPPEQFESLIGMMRIGGFIDLITIGLTVALIAPLVEEALFRGFFQRFFEKRRGVTSGVLLASGLFALYHFNVYFLIPILLMATVLGAMAWRSESVLPPAVAHSVNNCLGLIDANTDQVDQGLYTLGGHVAPWWVIFTLLLLIWSLRNFFTHAEAYGLGGHGPSGDSGSNVNMTV